MSKQLKTARKSTGGPAPGPRRTPGTGQRSESPEMMNDDSNDAQGSSTQYRNDSDSNRNSRQQYNSGGNIKPLYEVSPMELQIRQVELMEEQCDSLEKLVEIAAERRDIEKELLEIKKRKLALLEKQMQNQ